MSNDFMTQEEVDALLKGVTGEEDAPVQDDQPGGVRPDARQRHCAHGQAPSPRSAPVIESAVGWCTSPASRPSASSTTRSA